MTRTTNDNHPSARVGRAAERLCLAHAESTPVDTTIYHYMNREWTRDKLRADAEAEAAGLDPDQWIGASSYSTAGCPTFDLPALQDATPRPPRARKRAKAQACVQHITSFDDVGDGDWAATHYTLRRRRARGAALPQKRAAANPGAAFRNNSRPSPG
jgi:hypothetical protein